MDDSGMILVKQCNNSECYVLFHDFVLTDIWKTSKNYQENHLVEQNINLLWPSNAIWWQIWINIGSGDGLLPDGTKPLPEPMLTYHQWGDVEFM